MTELVERGSIANNGWVPTPGASGANSGAPKTLWYLTDALGSTLGILEKLV